MISVFYLLNLMVLLSGCWTIRRKFKGKQFSLSLIRLLAVLPLLALEYFFIGSSDSPQFVRLLFISEILFSFIWVGIGLSLKSAFGPAIRGSDYICFAEIGVVTAAFTGVSILNLPVMNVYENSGVLFHKSHLFFFQNLFILMAMAFTAWQLEIFWKKLSLRERWEYKSLVVGCYLICGVCGWSAAYRFTYHRMGIDHFYLTGSLFVFGWLLIGFAVIRHRLLNRKIYISRKVVYASVAPLVFGLYLITIGLVTFFMRLFHLPFPFVFRWFLIIAGFVFLVLTVVSGKVRHAVRYYISTHFYINKYEYRDEWLAFSESLHGALTESEVISAFQKVLNRTLYTNLILIWLNDGKGGFYLVNGKKDMSAANIVRYIPSDHPLIGRLIKKGRYYSGMTKRGMHEPSSVHTENSAFQVEEAAVLYSPLAIGENLMGIVGLGPEFTGGKYGEDDFDLLKALGTQTAAALLAARMSEAAARSRQQEAWDVMSAFVLHDVKNAANMLSLLRQNAPEHIHKPEFQTDMLETVDDALKRMSKVQDRLHQLSREIRPNLQQVDLCGMFCRFCAKMENRLRGLRILFTCDSEIIITTDPDLLKQVIENLLINALEAGGTEVKLSVYPDRNRKAVMAVSDNGTGIPKDMQPDEIFHPFKTGKAKGSGIGLWQAKRLVTILGGNIKAENQESGGARFIINTNVNGLK